MYTDFIFVCDYAEATGKINALGIGFDTIFAPKIPVKHGSFFLVFKLRASGVESGEKDIKVALIDEDGKSVIPDLISKIIFNKPVEGLESKTQVALQFTNVEFPKYGVYSLKLAVAGVEMGSIPIRVAPPPQSR